MGDPLGFFTFILLRNTKKLKGEPQVSSSFVCYVRKVKNEKGPFAITWIRFPGIHLVEQTEQKFRRIRKKTSDCNSRTHSKSVDYKQYSLVHIS